MYSNVTLRLKPKEASDIQLIEQRLESALKIKLNEINDFKIVRRSIDARKLPVMINITVTVATGDDTLLPIESNIIQFNKVPENAPRLIIVGAGPAGLFAALEAIRRGVRPIVLERGSDVDKRRIDIANISKTKRINPISNYCFGEGGAGAYSDGKLYTRSKKRGSIEEVLQILVQHGASPNILIEAHPHIGSDKLPQVIKNIRNTIKECGGEVHFETRVEDLLIEGNEIKGVTANGQEIWGEGVVLATGHSAHDTFKSLHNQGIAMEAKGIAMGVRLEHPQHLIDRIQYKSKDGRGEYLPAAEYSFVTQCEGRGVYSFCMCPGGVIVPAGSSDGELVVNGMSASARSGKWANSGMVVEIHPGDLPSSEAGSPLEIMDVQESLEKKIFESSDHSIIAPAQRMKDFVEKRKSSSLPSTSYAPGIYSADFNELLPDFIARRLKEGFCAFGRKAKGFLTNEAILVGLESRTSSPIRILRDKNTYESTSHKNLYPAGEGAGYAGGIVSAAIDGINCARAFTTNKLC